MQLRLMAERHHRWLWNELLFLVHFKTPISTSEARAEILKKTRIELAERRNCSCYPKVTSLNEETLRVRDCVGATSAVFVSVDTGRTPSSCYTFPQTYSPKPMKNRAEIPECLADAPRSQQPIFHRSYGLVQKLCFFFEKSSHHLPRCWY